MINKQLYVKYRFICEAGRLTSNIIAVSDALNIDGFLVTVEIEKAFDSLNHSLALMYFDASSALVQVLLTRLRLF